MNNSVWMALIRPVMLVGVVLASVLGSVPQWVVAQPAPQAGPPIIPARIFGTVQIDGGQAPVNTEVIASSGNKVLASAKTTITGGESVYVMDVPGDDPNTRDLVEGAQDGEMIVFRVNDLQANQTAVWHSGTFIELNLAAIVVPPITPTATSVPPVVAPMSSVPFSGSVYVVQPGDSLSKLARQFSVTIRALALANDLNKNSYLYIGQRLYIPATTYASNCTRAYFVQRGETLSSIAAYFGIDYYRLGRINGIHNPNYIYVGQRMCIPDIYAGG